MTGNKAATPDFLGQYWNNLNITTIGGGGAGTFTDTNTTAPQKFYRTVYP